MWCSSTNDDLSHAEKGQRAPTSKDKAVIALQNGDLNDLLDNMTLLIFDIVADDEESERRRRRSKGQRVVENEKVNQGQSLDIADLDKVFGTIERAKNMKVKKKLPSKTTFWLGVLQTYSWFLEGMFPSCYKGRRVGTTGIPVIFNAIQMFCAPLIMVGIPKWTRCPPSVMYHVWWVWLWYTLIAYIPILGTIYYVGKAPVTKACQRLSVYLILRKLMLDGRHNGEKTKRGKLYRSDRLFQFLNQQVTYPKSLHLDVTGGWSSCCSCLW